MRALRLGAPPAVSTAARLANIPAGSWPVSAAVNIHWDAYQIPSIEATDEWDLAVGLGAVHAHLRLAQMEAMRRIALGQISEIIGPAGIELDRALRLVDFPRAAPGIEAMLPVATRRWLEGFLAGVNHHIAHASAQPHEFALLGMAAEPWTLRHLLAVSRLASADVSWLVFTRLLHAEARMPAAEWAQLWPAMQDGDTLPWPSNLEEAALGLVRGSNSAAVPAARSASGAGMIASDPHLSITLPAMWLVAGLHCPGFDAVGLMIPGLPALGLGRNAAIAWGGTSLHAASSDLVDVSAEPMARRRETVRVKGRPSVELLLRETRFGPVVSDGMLFASARPLSLQWVGHRPSDEFTALLGVMHAGGFEQFRDALAGFALPGQTMVMVEMPGSNGGRAGRVTAAHLPRRPDAPMASVVCDPAAMWPLDDLVPASRSAAAGHEVVTSANERPPALPVPVGFFFAPPERASRLNALLAGSAISPDTLRSVQLDVIQPRSVAMRDALLPRLRASSRDQPALAALAAWDGSYGRASQGALVFEALATALARRLIPRASLHLLGAIWTGRAIAAHRILQAPQPDLDAAFRQAARVLRRCGAWGGAHRLALRHPLAALPLVGARYATPGMAMPGSNDTLNKTGHGPVRGRHRVTFGACARHFSDMADPDANHFVLLGGQDGWLGSANAADQVALWQAGGGITVPLRPEPARTWPHHTTLSP